ncbi:MAG: RHS repeat-associated core domain-containing protein [Anaerolineae bacterium]|nr:RHS repeat-associated core domain-containing protein [Anaerolineae bacterium]
MLGNSSSASSLFSPITFGFAQLLGSTVAVSDAAGQAVGRVQYDPYGEVLTSTLPVTLTERLFTGARFDGTIGLYQMGARFDGTIGLYQMGARWYDPALGRFVSPDTIVPDSLNPQAWNRFSYVYNNPASYVDPSGHVPVILLIAAVGFLAGEIYAGTQGYTPRDIEFWTYSANAAVAAVGIYFLGAELAIAGGLGLQQAGLWWGSATVFGWGLGLSSAGYGMYAWAFQPLDFSRWRQLSLAIWGHPNARAADVTLEGFVERAFNGDWELYYRFIRELEGGLPEGTSVVARGSSVTGYKWTTGEPFDRLGPGTSDIDLVLIGERAMKEWLPSEFKIPGVYTANLGDATPHVAPGLNPLRLELQAIVGRPVNIQAASRAYMDVRHFIQGKPYLPLIMR